MHLIEVHNEQHKKDFILANVVINKNFPGYIRPLDKDVNDVFDPVKNKAFRHGEIKRWLLKSNEGELLGRIAAFVNKKYKNKDDDVEPGGMGFFDCINDQNAADLLFDVARNWLLSKGMEAMDGPINFGERDKWWGLLTEGFQEPLYCMNFNQPYYKVLFETYGFKLFFNQICLGANPRLAVTEKVIQRHTEVSLNKNIRAEIVQKKHLEKYARAFTTVYNKAWAGHGGLKQMKYEQVINMFKKMKPVLDPHIAVFIFNKEEPIALFLNLPDLNLYFKHFKGKFGLWQKIRFFWMLKTRPLTRFTGLIFGIVPEFQGKGIDSYMIKEAHHQIVEHTQYDVCELQWIGDFNPRMLNVAENLGDTFRTRNLVTYRYIFDRTKEFKRHPLI